MKPVNEKISDQAIRHAIHLLKYGNGVQKDIVKLLNASDKALVEKIAARLVSIDKRGIDIGPATTKRLNKMLAEIRELNSQVYSKVQKQLVSELTELAGSEALFQSAALESALPVEIAAVVPPAAKLKAMVTSRPLVEGQLLKPFMDGMEVGRATRIEKAIRIGILQGLGTDAIVRTIKGTKKLKYKDGILEISRRSAKSIVRTSVNSVANQAAQETWKANSDIIEKWQFTATLDSRTTVICGSNDGRTFDVGTGPIPPLHIGCRSISVAITKSFKQLGLDKKDYDFETRASIDGQVPASTTFESWLKKQPEDIQDKVLGKTKADIFRSGKLNLRDFVRDDREVISLEQLKKLHPKIAAKKAAAKAVTKPAIQATQKGAFASPLANGVTNQSVSVGPRLKAQKDLSKTLSKSSQDPRYSSVPEFRNVKANQFGKAVFNKDMTDETASMITQIHPELDEMADAFNVPRIRGYKMNMSRSATASMGDGIMTLNPAYFNTFSTKIGNKGSANFSKLENTASDLNSKLDKQQIELDALSTKIKTARGDAEKYRTLFAERKTAAKSYNRDVDKLNKTTRQLAVLKAAEKKSVSKWKIGDEAAKRPFGAKDYFSDIDSARSVLYHEFGHHIHQMYKKNGPRVTHGLPPIEAELKQLYRKFFTDRSLKTKAASTYSLANEKEWFAENFSLYMMNKKTLVDPDVSKLIGRLLNEASR